jgi:hypothetical protein
MEVEWDRSYNASVRRGRLIELFEARGLLSDFIDQVWPFGRSPQGQAELRRCLRIKRQYDEFLAGGDTVTPAQEQDEEEALQFALEAPLRDFLAKNLELIEPGLHLYTTEDRTGVEFRVDEGRIDLLAVDHAGKYVVIELKLSRGRNKTLGQLLYYIGLGGPASW